MKERFTSKKFLILMTACVTPNSYHMLHITNPRERAEQYTKALRWYYYNTPFDIVFAENSGAMIDIDEEILNSNRVEFLSWKEGPDAIDRGKGWKEAKIQEKVIKESVLYRDADVVVKVTGRLILENILTMAKKISRVAPSPFLLCWFLWDFKWLDSRFYFVDKGSFEYLNKFNHAISSTKALEVVYAAACKELISSGVTYFYPPHMPIVKGVCGGNGENYSKRGYQYWKRNIKYLVHYLIHRRTIVEEIIMSCTEYSDSK